MNNFLTNNGLMKFIKTNPLLLIIFFAFLFMIALSIIIISASLGSNSTTVLQNASDINITGGSKVSTESSKNESINGVNNSTGNSISNSSKGSNNGNGIIPTVKPISKVEITLHKTNIPGYESVITECSVTDFGAVADGKTDVTENFQSALNYVNELGGGTVWVPAGKYYFAYSLNIPKSCYLFGEWNNPDTAPTKISDGTVFLVNANKGIDDDQKPFIALGTSAGIVGITIYYPEQSATNPVKFPATLKARDAVGGRSGYPTIKYTTIVNPYNGVNFGPDGNELTYIYHLYMSPLNRGVFINLSTDVSRIENLHISAKYYALYQKNVNQTDLAILMKQRVIGIRIQRSDWQSLNYSSISDVYIAIKSEKQTPVTNPPVNSANIESYDLTIQNCVYGIYFEYNDTIHQFTNTKISTDNECIRVLKAFNGSMAVNKATFKSLNTSCIAIEANSKGSVSIMDSAFTGWSGARYPVEANGGGIVVDNCTASSAGTIYVGSLASGASINNVTNLTVSNNIGSKSSIGTGSYSAVNYFDELASLGNVPFISTNNFITVTSKGAKPNGKSDSTSAFQSALDEVKSLGGGIVYIPAGIYLLNGTLTIPTGVELRGVSLAPHHSSAMGSILFTTQGEGNANGTPFISLKQGAGVRGFLVWYSNQKYDAPKLYPWTIKSEAANAWVVDVTIGGGWQGVYLGNNSGGHYIYGYTGFNFKTDVYIDGSNAKGYVYNCHFNPHFYGRAIPTELPGTGCMFNTDEFIKFMQICDKTKVSFVLGKTTNEVMFGSFNYRANIGISFINGTGGNFDGILKGCGYDACITGIKVQATSGTVNIINFLSDIVPPSSKYMDMSGGDVRFINGGFSAFNWSPSDTNSPSGDGIVQNGGNLEIRQICFNASTGTGAIKVNGGNCNIMGVVFRHFGKSVGTGQDIYFENQTAAVKDVVRIGGTVNVTTTLGRVFNNTSGTINGVSGCKTY